MKLANNCASVFQQCLSDFCFHEIIKKKMIQVHVCVCTWGREKEKKRKRRQSMRGKIPSKENKYYRFLTAFHVIFRSVIFSYPKNSSLYILGTRAIYVVNLDSSHFHYLNLFCWADVLKCYCHQLCQLLALRLTFYLI